jgi:NitT/TauT family transport system permease protein
LRVPVISSRRATARRSRTPESAADAHSALGEAAQSPRWFAIAQRVGIPVLLFVAIVGSWELIVVLLEIPQYTLPRPSEILASFEGQWGSMMHHARLTATEALLGYALGNGVALIMAAFMGEFRLLERSLYPYVLVLRSLPIVAVAPLLIIWFGFTIWPIVSAAALICFFPTLVNGIEGFKATDATTLELMRGLNASRWQTFAYVKVPNALPYIFAALKISVASSLVGAVVGEWIAADEGLGYLTIVANNFVNTLLLFRAVLLVSAIAILWFLMIMALERWFLRWHRVESA